MTVSPTWSETQPDATFQDVVSELTRRRSTGEALEAMITAAGFCFSPIEVPQARPDLQETLAIEEIDLKAVS